MVEICFGRLILWYYFATSIKILIYQPQCYMIYGEVNNQMFIIDFQYNY